MPDKFVAVTFAKQETLFFCGPAAAQMALSALGVASPATPPSWQSQLWDYIKANTGATRPASAPSEPTAPPFPTQKCEWCTQWKCWSTTPAVLTQLLNTSQGVAQFSISTHVIEDTATGVMLDTLDDNVPGVALVYGWNHWVVVDGYRHSEPGSHAVAGRHLNGVYIRDPEGTANVHYLDWIEWRDTYLSFVPCGAYKNKMVVLGGVRVAAPPIRPPQAPTNLRILSVPPPDPLAMIKSIIPPEQAIQRATEQLGALRTSRLRAAVQAVEAKVALLVQRLDDPDLYYYIVTFQGAAKETARVVVDAFDGTFRQATGIEREGDSLAPYVPPTAALSRLQSEAEIAPDALRFRVRAGTVGQHPVLVWKPCKQSTSPFLPFYQLSVGDSFVYYRVDGKEFDALTESPA